MTTGLRHKAFTYRYSQPVNVLFTEINVSLPFDPNIDSGKTLPSLISCNAIWDTGASSSVITKSLAKKINLIPTGKEKVVNTSNVELKNTYIININLPNKVTVAYVKVTECEDVLGNGNAEMLIGMDIIGMGDFAITKENKKTVMSFIMPSIDTIDYVPISEEKNHKLDLSEKILRNSPSHKQPKKKLRLKHKIERQNKKKNHKHKKK